MQVGTSDGPATAATDQGNATDYAQILAEAERIWSLAFPNNGLQLSISLQDLPGSELAEAQIDAYGANGLPTSGTIVLDANANGVGWYVDPTPSDNSEFATALSGGAFLANGNSPAAGKYDLLTVLLHEEGHLLGFDPDVPGYTAHVGTVDGSQIFSGPGFTAELTPAPDDDHLDSGAYPNDLMTAALAPSERRLPSALDEEIIATVRNTSAALLAASGGVPVVPTVTSQHAADLMAEQLPSNWTSFGTTSVNGGTLVLRKTRRRISGLSESFVVPQGVDTLQFTVLADHLLANANGDLPDAFEAALLDQNGNPVNGSAIGLSNTDLFLNIQSNGQIFFGPGVTVSGRSASGGSGSLSTPITVTEDLSGIAAGTTLTLYFDLLGFGAADSSVTVNVSRQRSGPGGPECHGERAGGRPGDFGRGLLHRSRCRRHRTRSRSTMPAPRARSPITATAASAMIRTAPSTA